MCIQNISKFFLKIFFHHKISFKKRGNIDKKLTKKREKLGKNG